MSLTHESTQGEHRNVNEVRGNSNKKYRRDKDKNKRQKLRRPDQNSQTPSNSLDDQMAMYPAQNYGRNTPRALSQFKI